MLRTIALVLCIAAPLISCTPQLPQEPVAVEAGVSQSRSDTAPAIKAPEASPVKSNAIDIKNLVNFKEDCNIEAVNGILFDGKPMVLAKSKMHGVTGWLVNPSEKSTGKELKLVLAGTGAITEVWTTQLSKRISRTDVAQVRGYAPQWADSGFSFEVDLKALTPGDYHLYVLLANFDGVAVCDPGRQIRITP